MGKGSGRGDGNGRHARSEESRVDLGASAIHEQLVARLMLAHSSSTALVTPSDSRTPPTHAEVSLLAQTAIEGDVQRGHDLVASMVRQGMSVESVLLFLLAPAARSLSEGWNDEQSPFAEVMAALEVIEQVATTLTTPSQGSDSV